jgi:hypothetical protein
MVINNGGTFRNASGASSGNAVSIGDSIRIANNGTYIHNAASGHAANVQLFSAAPGTEAGTFELNVPTASSTISLSGRTFGNLKLNAAAAGGSCNYTAAGAAKVKIRGDLKLGTGVSLALNFSDSILVKGDLMQDGGTLNLGTSIKSTVLEIGGDITQANGAVITESGLGTQSIVLANTATQLLNLRGNIQNNIAVVKKGMGLSVLKSPLSLPFKLSLKQGRVITTDEWLLTLQSGCTIEADTITGAGFIVGPLRKEGLNNSDFLFPVGNTAGMRWLRLEHAKGSYTVQYVKSDPTDLSSQTGSGIDHVSKLEYWEVISDAASSAIVKLSFDNYSGGVTNLAALRVGRLVNGVWQNAGNSGYAGTPGANGWVSSSTASGFSASSMSFALASAMGQENPLPFLNMQLFVSRNHQQLHFTWQLKDTDLTPSVFQLQESDDGKHFSTCKSLSVMDGQLSFACDYVAPYLRPYYRLRMKTATGTEWYESVPVFLDIQKADRLSIEGSNVVADALQIAVSSATERDVRLVVYNAQGALQKLWYVHVQSGSSLISLNTADLPVGLYFLCERSGVFRDPVLRFVKK